MLPQASVGFPGATQVTEYITIAESRWRQQLAGLGRTLGAEMLIAFPDDDEVRLAVGGFLREAQRLLGGGEVDGAMLQVRKALETIKNTGSWTWPAGKKDKGEIAAGERWALIRAAVEDQASGAMHVDLGTKDYTYSRTEVEALIAITAALLNVLPLPRTGSRNEQRRQPGRPGAQETDAMNAIGRLIAGRLVPRRHFGRCPARWCRPAPRCHRRGQRVAA